ncbi:E3 SUMO-protein ligase pli1 [Babesia caballi]|uniref:E3 SUMO-protein ligase pli1 n=1 Tax=Babesia caballi TaxID=5871 RepID=A0AAV4LVP8_BABCB|nr:E3 SUMO-protein ligase pli1 [Babesia caballi]
MGSRTAIFKVDISDLDKWVSQNKDVYIVSLPLSKNKLMHEWPRTFELSINNEVVHVVKEPTWGHLRRDNPIKVTYAMRPGENLIELSSTTYDENGPPFLIIVMVSKRVTVQRIIETIRRKRTIPFNDSKRRVLELINRKRDDDEVICIQGSHKIELNCPITLDRIELPTRGKHCEHIQCFDLNGYLQVMQNVSTFNTRWKCPECHLIVKPMDLVIDGYVLQILETVPQGTSTVEVDESGGYKAVKMNGSMGDISHFSESIPTYDVGDVSGDSSSCSVYTTSALSEDSCAISPHDRKFKPNTVGKHHGKDENDSNLGRTFRLDHADEAPSNASRAIPVCTREIISLDSSDESDSQHGGDHTHGGKPSKLHNLGSSKNSNKISSAETDARFDSRKVTKVHNGEKNRFQIVKRPQSTLSERLRRLPQIASSPLSTARGTTLKCPSSDAATKTQANLTTTHSEASNCPRSGCKRSNVDHMMEHNTRANVGIQRFPFFG